MLQNELLKTLKNIKEREGGLNGIEEVSNKAGSTTHSLKQAVGAVGGACLLELLCVNEVEELDGPVQVLWILC